MTPPSARKGRDGVGVDRRYLAMLASTVAWVLVLVLPLYRADFLLAFATRMQWGPNMLAVFAAAQLVTLAEIALVSAGLWAARRLPRGRAMRGLAMTLALAVAFAYHGLVFLSWAYHGATGAFMGARVLALAPFVTSDPGAFWSYLSDEDRARAVRALVATVAVTALAAAASWSSARRWPARGRLVVAALAFAAAGSIGVASRGLLPEARRSIAVQVIRHGASPSLTLWWAPLVAPLPELRLPPARLERLEPRAAVPAGRAAPDALDLHVFVVEALRSDVATELEHAATTPFFHRLAAGPLSRARALAQAPETSESVAVLLSGNYALRSEARDLRIDAGDRQSVLERLRAAGYRTAFLGEEWRIDEMLTRQGVDFRLNPQDMRGAFEGDPHDPWRTGTYVEIESDRLKLRRLVDWAQAQAAPVATMTYLQASHYPYRNDGMETPYMPIDVGDDHSFLGFDRALHAPMWNRYRNVVHALDDLLARAVDALDTARPGRARVVVITGDHGEGFGEHGEVTHARALYPEVLLVPLLVDAPDGWHPAGPALAAHVDLFSTLLTFASVPIPPNQGDPLVARAPSALRERPAFATSQLYLSEDAVATNGTLFALSHDTLAMRLFDLTTSALLDDAQRRASACACVLEHRAQQLRYHAPGRSLAASHAPPRWERCAAEQAGIDECARIAR